VIPQQRLFGTQVAIGEPIRLEGNTEFRRDVESSLEIIAQERLREVEAQAKSLLVRAKEESAKILEQANTQAKAVLDQAHSEVGSIRDSAHEEGFKTGYSEGYTDATTQVTDETRQMLEGAQTLVDGAYLAEQRVMKHFESHALELIRHIVRQILGRELSDSPETVMRMIERAIASLYVSGKVQVVVSAQVIHELRAYATATEQALNTMSRFEFIADPVLERNQIYIISQEGCFDLSPDTQLAHLLTAIEPHLTLPHDLPPDLPASQVALAGEASSASVATEGSGLEQQETTDEPLPISLDSEILDSTELAIPSSTDVERVMPVLNLQQSEEQIAEPESTVGVEQTIEPDPVAWDEFPSEVQSLDGFPPLQQGELEADDAEIPSENTFLSWDKETLP